MAGTRPSLDIYNSLTRSKQAFQPIEPGKVTWYACGPTVYDASHLGHARTYVSTDIIRRILRDYYGLNVELVMNITDIDDKIIIKGRNQYQFRKFVEQHQQKNDSVLEQARKALKAYASQNLAAIGDPDDDLTVYEAKLAKEMAAATDPLLRDHITSMRRTSEAISRWPDTSLQDFYTAAEPVLMPYLGITQSTPGSQHSIWTSLTRKYEDEFWEDMWSLNVEPPSEITRVTEFVPEILSFIQKLIDQGFAYVTQDSSVYFSISEYKKAGYKYPMLSPEMADDEAAFADGEGKLTKAEGKRAKNDFALWKASKGSEPEYPAPWGGVGRPGWHIECSVMATQILGRSMDMHSGGIDLAFPHHDNEIAQSEAFYYSKDDPKGRIKSAQAGETPSPSTWVNHFLHTGHLHIEGQKMSKSLKNFTTISEALTSKGWTARTLRIVFLLGGWRDGVDFTPALMQAAHAWEDKVTNFFVNVQDQRTYPATADANASTALNTAVTEVKEKVRKSLDDSFNTASAMAALSELITTFNSLASEKGGFEQQALNNAATCIARMVRIFGLDTGSLHSPEITWEGVSVASQEQPILDSLKVARQLLRESLERDVLSEFKAIQKPTTSQLPIRSISSSQQTATNGDTPSTNGTSSKQTTRSRGRVPASRPPPPMSTFQASNASRLSQLSQLTDDFITSGLNILESPSPDKKAVLALTDSLRDSGLWNLGYYLEDRKDRPTLIRPLTRDIRKAREDREKIANEKAERQRKVAEQEAARLEKAKVPPEKMFKTEEARKEFTKWDEMGVPVMMKGPDGAEVEVTKSARKKLVKAWELQRKEHEKWKASQGASAA